MSLHIAERIADAVLYEGYVLYPYRASAAKNRLRWQVGLVAPREYVEAAGADSWHMQTECLAEAGDDATLTVRVRCLHVQSRTIQKAADPDGLAWQPVDTMMVDDRQLVTWDEAVVSEFTAAPVPLREVALDRSHCWRLEQAEDVERVLDRSGQVAARIVRRRLPVTSTVRIAVEPLGGLVKVRVRIENCTPSAARTLSLRDAAVRQSLAGAHTLLALEGGAFLSLLEPPATAAALAAGCVNEHTWPVLVGDGESRSVMLSSPVILYDYPSIAPESPGDFCDATEIDEMLMLRVQTLTDHEKREGRATDERAARIIDRAETASPAVMRGLHGAVRSYRDAAEPPRLEDWETFVNPPDAAPPEAASIQIGSLRIGNGSRVRLRPTHRADSMDICLDGRLATVTAVYHTLEDKPYVAVTLDDDPFAESGMRYRRALFFHPDEIVPLDQIAGAAG